MKSEPQQGAEADRSPIGLLRLSSVLDGLERKSFGVMGIGPVDARTTSS